MIFNSRYLPDDHEEDGSKEEEYKGMIDVVGDDKAGRRIIVVAACRFPDNKDLDTKSFIRFIINSCHWLVCSNF